MKKSQLRQIIRQLVKEQMDIDLPPMLKSKGKSGPFNPFGNTNPNMMGAGNQPPKFTPRDAQALHKSLGSPRNLEAYKQALINKGHDANAVNKAIAEVMQRYGIGPNEPINPSALPVWVWYVGRAILYGVGGGVVGSAIGL